jgi:hypothetical protein
MAQGGDGVAEYRAALAGQLGGGGTLPRLSRLSRSGSTWTRLVPPGGKLVLECGAWKDKEFPPFLPQRAGTGRQRCRFAGDNCV